VLCALLAGHRLCLMCFSKQLAKFAMLILPVLLLLCYGVGNVHYVHENTTDLHSLLDFKQGITSDPNGALSSWNASIHYCRWMYVVCTQTRPWRVSVLNLTSQSLTGNITSSLANLTFLSVLDLSYNSLFGQLPFLDLQELDTLYLYGNSLEGSIPDALTNCSKLRILDLDSNQLSGPIPPKVGSLTNLEYLDLSYNSISGIIPPTLPNLPRLSYCNLQANKLKGSIPVGIWQLSNMGTLSLGNNSLSGEIPQAINMSALEILGLEFNKLGKALPSDFGDAFPSLQNLYLDNNIFKGQIPWSLGNASLLGLIDLSVNSFTSQVPASLGKLTNLNSLNLETNKLEAGDRQSWGFLDALTNCRSLTNLSLYDNRLGGDIPESVGSLSTMLQSLSTMLQSLSLGANKLTGTVPSSIGNLHNLIRLALGENSLSGEIGEWVGKLKKTYKVYFSKEKCFGPI